MTSLLDTVSTTRGSGWVADQRCDVANNFESERLSHLLPQVVLTCVQADGALPQSMTSLLDTVSTTRGSGWVADQRCDVANDFESERLSHLLPQVVLTVSKLMALFLKV